jgi:hypothetical protein
MSAAPTPAVEGLTAEQVKEAVSSAQRLVDVYVGVVRRHIRDEVSLLDKEQAWVDAMKAIANLGAIALAASPSTAASNAGEPDEQKQQCAVLDELAIRKSRRMGAGNPLAYRADHVAI